MGVGGSNLKIHDQREMYKYRKHLKLMERERERESSHAGS
jgi:hypothetical protein